MPRKRKSRMYLMRGRYYADFRDFADVDGKREALIPARETTATADPDLAARLMTDRLEELERKREERRQGVKARAFGIDANPGDTLARYAARHLELKARDGEAVPVWLTQAQRHLEAAVAYFGAHADLASLTPAAMTGYVEHLRRLENGRGGTLSNTSVRKYLNSLSNLYKRAVSEQRVKLNPVAAMYSKPTENKVEAEYLEPEEAALLLESARTFRPAVDPVHQEHGGAISAHANPWTYPILATFLLTGGRKSEVLGLEVDDVSFRLGKIYFRSNDWRRLKTKRSKRSVPLWPQLREILGEYMIQREQQGGLGSLLFPSEGGRVRSGDRSAERMILDLRRALDRIGERAGFPAGHVRLHMLRHTYTAARIQTLDRGAPVSMYTVARELGHSSTNMIEDRYGHLHDRAVLGGSEVVEFRVEHHQEALRHRLRALRAK